MRIVRMKTDKLAKIQEYANAIAELLYEETAPEQVKTLEGIEEAVRDHLLNYVNPEIAKILSTKAVEPTQVESEK
jgi:hypothetical protein